MDIYLKMFGGCLVFFKSVFDLTKIFANLSLARGSCCLSFVQISFGGGSLSSVVVNNNLISFSWINYLLYLLSLFSLFRLFWRELLLFPAQNKRHF